MNKKRGIGLIVWGIILGVIGGGCVLLGNITDNDLGRQWNSYWSSGRADATGKVLLYIGIVLIVIGAIMAIIGIIRYTSSVINIGNTIKPSGFETNKTQLTEDKDTQSKQLVAQKKNRPRGKVLALVIIEFITSAIIIVFGVFYSIIWLLQFGFPDGYKLIIILLRILLAVIYIISGVMLLRKQKIYFFKSIIVITVIFTVSGFISNIHYYEYNVLRTIFTVLINNVLLYIIIVLNILCKRKLDSMSALNVE